jgi:hypothetical protein
MEVPLRQLLSLRGLLQTSSVSGELVIALQERDAQVAELDRGALMMILQSNMTARLT